MYGFSNVITKIKKKKTIGKVIEDIKSKVIEETKSKKSKKFSGIF